MCTNRVNACSDITKQWLPQVQREGDELDAKIKKTEAELVALENTCEVLKENNEEYRRNLSSPLETEEEQEMATHLQQLIVQTEEQVKERRLHLLDIQDKVQAMQGELDQLTEEQNSLDRQREELERQMAAKDKELKEQEAKLDRATRFNNHVIKQLRRKTGHIASTQEEQDIEVRVRREEVKLAARSLCQLTELDEEARELVVATLEESGISVPESRASSSQASRRSELVSCTSMESICSDSSGGTPASQRSQLRFPSQQSTAAEQPEEEDKTSRASSRGSSRDSSGGSSRDSSRSSSRTGSVRSVRSDASGGKQSARSGVTGSRQSVRSNASGSRKSDKTTPSNSRPTSQQGSQVSVVNIDFSDLSRPASNASVKSGASATNAAASRSKTKKK